MAINGTIKTLYEDKENTKPILPRTSINAVTDLTSTLAGKQETLISGTNIKTINNQSILGSGNLATSGQWGLIDGTLSNQADLQLALNNKQDILISTRNIKSLNGASLLGEGNILNISSTMTYEVVD